MYEDEIIIIKGIQTELEKNGIKVRYYPTAEQISYMDNIAPFLALGQNDDEYIAIYNGSIRIMSMRAKNKPEFPLSDPNSINNIVNYYKVNNDGC